MNLYELTYILRSDLDDDALKTVEERINGRLSEAAGELVKAEGWGRRRLAYPIERIKEGFYFTSILRMPGDQVAAFENQLKLVPEILRFLLIRQEERNINLAGSLLPASQRATPSPPVEPVEAAVEQPAATEEAGTSGTAEVVTTGEEAVPAQAESTPTAEPEGLTEAQEPASSADETREPSEAEAVSVEAQG